MGSPWVAHAGIQVASESFTVSSRDLRLGSHWWLPWGLRGLCRGFPFVGRTNGQKSGSGFLRTVTCNRRAVLGRIVCDPGSPKPTVAGHLETTHLDHSRRGTEVRRARALRASVARGAPDGGHDSGTEGRGNSPL